MTGTQGGSCVLETAASNLERLTGTTTTKKNETAVSIELVAGSIFGGLLRRTREKKSGEMLTCRKAEEEEEEEEKSC